MVFANGTVIGVSSEEDVRVVEKLIELYERASNSKVNVEKTWNLDVGPDSTTFRHLGVQFNSNGPDLAENEEYRSLSLEAKVLFLNVFIFSKLWYLAHIIRGFL